MRILQQTHEYVLCVVSSPVAVAWLTKNAKPPSSTRALRLVPGLWARRAHSAHERLVFATARVSCGLRTHLLLAAVIRAAKLKFLPRRKPLLGPSPGTDRLALSASMKIRDEYPRSIVHANKGIFAPSFQRKECANAAVCLLGCCGHRFSEFLSGGFRCPTEIPALECTMLELEVGGDMATAREVRIVLVPVGAISERKFAEFASLIRSFSCIELCNVTRRETKGLSDGSIEKFCLTNSVKVARPSSSNRGKMDASSTVSLTAVHLGEVTGKTSKPTGRSWGYKHF